MYTTQLYQRPRRWENSHHMLYQKLATRSRLVIVFFLLDLIIRERGYCWFTFSPWSSWLIQWVQWTTLLLSSLWGRLGVRTGWQGRAVLLKDCTVHRQLCTACPNLQQTYGHDLNTTFNKKKIWKRGLIRAVVTETAIGFHFKIAETHHFCLSVIAWERNCKR